ncbi:hypothetical protein pb186bvf_014852 [Paramecium bursaria]
MHIQVNQEHSIKLKAIKQYQKSQKNKTIIIITVTLGIIIAEYVISLRLHN